MKSERKPNNICEIPVGCAPACEFLRTKDRNRTKDDETKSGDGPLHILRAGKLNSSQVWILKDAQSSPFWTSLRTLREETITESPFCEQDFCIADRFGCFAAQAKIEL